MKLRRMRIDAGYKAINTQIMLYFSFSTASNFARQRRTITLCYSVCVVITYISREIPVTTLVGRLRLKCDGTRAENRFRLSAKWTSPLKSAGASVQWTADSRGVRISGSNDGYTMFRGSVKGTGYPLLSPVHLNRPVGVSSVDC